ncbi:MAG TPA: TonB-dependent receptor, partial [Opitutaceae bacterium]|nr:TonB-dependent receptor [Opitutaceae bacterium]
MKTPPTLPARSSRDRLPSSLALVLSALLVASAAHAADNQPANEEEVVRLSPFTVSQSESGYEPTESSTGARINVQLENLPFAVSTINSNYLQDFQVLNVSDELAFSSSLNGLRDNGQFNLRGFGGNISLRNGFSRLGSFQPVEIQRVEFIKGPAAAVYGQTNPGGIVNFITLTPSPVPSFSADTIFGSYDYQHTDVVVSTANTDKFAVVVAAQYENQHYISPRAASTDRLAYIDMVYNFSKTTSWSFDFDYDYEAYTGGSAGVALPFVDNVLVPATDPHRFTSIAWGVVHKYYIDSSQWSHRINYQYESIFQSKLASFLDLRLAGGIYEAPRYVYTTGLSSNYDPTTGNLIGNSGRPSYNLLLGVGRMGAMDLVAHYNWPGQGEQQTLLTVDYYDNIGKRPLWQAPAGTLPTTYNVFAGPADPQLPLVRNPNLSASSNTAFTSLGIVPFQAVSNAGGIMEDDFAETTGCSLRQYGNFLNNKLVVAAGLREDHVQLFKEFLGAKDGNLQQMETFYSQASNKFTKQFGLGWKLTHDIMAYANRTESFVPNSPSAAAASGVSTVFPPQTGVGYEAGVKADLPDHPDLSFTADVYTIRLDNVVVSVPNPANPGTTVSVGAGVQYSKGVEFDGNWQALPNLNILASLSGGNFWYGYQGTNTALVGLQTVNVPRFQGTMSVAYQATKSLLLTFDCRAFSSFRVSNSTVNGSVANTTASDGRLQIRGPGYGIFDFGA